MYTIINGKKYLVSMLRRIQRLDTAMGNCPYFLTKIEKFEGNYFKANYENKDHTETITRIVTIF